MRSGDFGLLTKEFLSSALPDQPRIAGVPLFPAAAVPVAALGLQRMQPRPGTAAVPASAVLFEHNGDRGPPQHNATATRTAPGLHSAFDFVFGPVSTARRSQRYFLPKNYGCDEPGWSGSSILRLHEAPAVRPNGRSPWPKSVAPLLPLIDRGNDNI